MRRRIGAALAAMAAVFLGAAAMADTVTLGDVNLRTGPGTAHERMTTIPRGAQVWLHGCTAAGTWCNVSWGGFRGWASAGWLQQRQGGFVVMQMAPGSMVVAPQVVAPQIVMIRPGAGVVTVSPQAHRAPSPLSQAWSVWQVPGTVQGVGMAGN